MKYQYRINQLRKLLMKLNHEAMIISSPSNLIYFSGFTPLDITEREAYILITQKYSYIFTSALYASEVKTYVQDFQVIELGASNLFTSLLKKVVQNEHLAKIGFEEHNITYAEYTKLQNIHIPLFPVDINHLRMQKDQEEIALISQACKIGDHAFNDILPQIHPGLTEEDVAFMLEDTLRKYKTITSFPTIVACGKNAAVPHHVTSQTILQKNQFILLDFGVKYKQYCSDMSRTIFLGNPSIKQKLAYQTVLQSQDIAINYLKEGIVHNDKITASQVDKISRDFLITHHFPSFPHSLGHGIGLQVHELPSISPFSPHLLQLGNVFSIEPGVYEHGTYGIRIEDLVTITKNDIELLTNSTRELICV